VPASVKPLKVYFAGVATTGAFSSGFFSTGAAAGATTGVVVGLSVVVLIFVIAFSFREVSVFHVNTDQGALQSTPSSRL
jgi:uncharacterized membrane protein (DUF485 family)